MKRLDSECGETKHSTHLGPVQNVNYFLAKINIYNICSISGSNIVCLPLSPSVPNYVAARTSAHSVAHIPSLLAGQKETHASRKEASPAHSFHPVVIVSAIYLLDTSNSGHFQPAGRSDSPNQQNVSNQQQCDRVRHSE